MKTLSLAINGTLVRTEIEPRLNLADFLREHQFLTGTHVGCEHGVCGACTVLIDGAPARSCITYALTCEGAEVVTIEGLEDDPAMGRLREAFSEHHALQCGYCTPGMLITARDILLRLPHADEQRVRMELSGNLCRCTGYVGIVAAVRSALAASNTSGEPVPTPQRRLGPVGSHPPAGPPSFAEVAPAARIVEGGSPAAAIDGRKADWRTVDAEGVELRQEFTVPFARAEVWGFFSELDQVVRCMPGARLTRPAQGDRAEGEVQVRLGPIVSVFQGVLHVERDGANFRGVVRAAGRDVKSPSNARAIIAYQVRPAGETASVVDVSVKFLLSGALAQFSRSGLIRDVADHLTRVFAGNLAARLAGSADAGAVDVLDAGAAARSAIWARIGGFFRGLLGRRQ